MFRIACLHTAESNVPIFEAALRDSGLTDVELRHAVRAELLTRAEHSGGLTPEVTARTIEALHALCEGADAVLLTCSTLGPATEAVDDTASCPILRVDAALAQAAVREGGRIVVLCTAETTIISTRLLFEDAARRSGATVTIRLVPGAWEAFRAGEPKRYLSLIAKAAETAAHGGATRVVLAQASMAGAAQLAAIDPPALTSPEAGLRAALEAIRDYSVR
ncbi:aspartate/glutamate racemase family protein [Roseomonas xinghualingensis]|uniref:aspartate/glutamate racemase family protein n=1 Tax=Roseomonas xinghualingensis TaxID=2986475 RepID=UPI0021F1D8A3|nr:aspartate/glutamate racemase family protein [Roseomonas sp. SXEYE001]MCV4206450.1 aspartate/glutamate racemase family protein [Roseomonas sp. SXEYE001]